jgi:hypothetical protein
MLREKKRERAPSCSFQFGRNVKHILDPARTSYATRRTALSDRLPNSSRQSTEHGWAERERGAAPIQPQHAHTRSMLFLAALCSHFRKTGVFSFTHRAQCPAINYANGNLLLILSPICGFHKAASIICWLINDDQYVNLCFWYC